jgi:hypothetical protein
MRRLIVIGVLSLFAYGAWCSPGAKFWECFGEYQSGGIPCMRACPECKAETGSRVNCDRVCGLPAIPAGSYAGRRIH